MCVNYTCTTKKSRVAAAARPDPSLAILRPAPPVVGASSASSSGAVVDVSAGELDTFLGWLKSKVGGASAAAPAEEEGRSLGRRRAEVRREALAVGDGDGEALAALALLAVVVPGEEVAAPFLEQRHGDGDGVLAELRRGGRPLDGVVRAGVVVVAALVQRLVPRLHHRVVLVRVEYCSSRSSNEHVRKTETAPA